MVIYVILAKQYSFKQPTRYNYLVTVQIAMKIKLAFLSFANYIIKDIWKREEKIFFSKVFKATFMLEAYWTLFQTSIVFCIHGGQTVWKKKPK